MNIHITWLTYVRTGPKKKNRFPVLGLGFTGSVFVKLYSS